MAKINTYARSSFVGEEVQRLAGLTVHNVLTYGAPTDGTSDCTTAVQAAINAALAAGGGTVYFPAGFYTFALASPALDPGAGKIRFVGDGMDQSILYYDAGADTNFATFKCLFRNTSGAIAKYSIEFESIQFQGSYPTRFRTGGSVVVCDNYERISIDKCKFYNIPNLVTQCESIENYVVTNCIFENCVADQVRFRSSRNGFIVGNYFKSSCDDSVAIHQASYISGAGNIRERCVIADNIFEDTLGIHNLGGRGMTITGNIFHRCKVGAIRLNLGSSAEPAQGVFGLTISGNLIYDTTYGSNSSSHAAAAINVDAGAAFVGSTPGSLLPGDVDSATGNIELPYSYRENFQTDVTKSYPPIYGVTITNNVIMRTLPDVSNYSDWGFGEMMTNAASGFEDPAMSTSVNMTPVAGIQISTNIVGLVVSDNVIMNCRRAIYVMNDPSETNCFGRIAGNQVFDCWEAGVYGVQTGTRHMNLVIENNHFNLDPYFVATGRQSDGSWSGSPTTRGITFNTTVNGLVIRGNIFQNCYLVFGGTFANNIIRDNIIKGEIAAFGTSSSNKGIGQSLAAGERFTYLQMDQTRTSGTYGEVQAGPGGQYTAQPSTGFWVRGEWVPNADPSSTAVLGWVRLTTGSAHVAGTDWKKVDIT